MTRHAYLKAAAALSLAGTLFAGYLSAVKLLTKTCAFNEPCPLFLGYPACWFGFGIFASLLLVSGSALAKRRTDDGPVKAILALSALGTLFAGRLVAQEAALWLSAGFSPYSLGLPTCVYGLVFYLALLILSVREIRRKPDLGQAAAPAAGTQKAP